MKIKNKYTKQKIDKKEQLVNRWINTKKYIRLKTQKIVKLSKKEDWLYNRKLLYKNGIPKIEDDKYIYLKNIMMINYITKNNCSKLYKGIINLYGNNPLRGFVGGGFNPKKLKKDIDDFSYSNNSERWMRLCEISPKENILYEYVNYIDISIFEASNDMIGIIFNLHLTNFAQNKLLEIMNEDVIVKPVYSMYKYKKRRSISITELSPESIRNDNYENMLLEIKDRCNKLFYKYIPLELEYNNNAPISLDIYQTNYDIKNSESRFLNSLDFYSTNIQEKDEISVCVREKDKSDDFIKTKMYYEISLKKDNINRSNNIFYYIDNKKLSIISVGSEYVNMALITIAFYELEEMIKDISLERNRLFSTNQGKFKRTYSQFCILNNKIHRYRMIYNGIKEHYFEYSDDYLKRGLENLKRRYKEYYNQYKELDKEYQFRMNINNSRSSYNFSKVSIIIAILALLLTIYFEYRKNTEDNQYIYIQQCNRNVNEDIIELIKEKEITN